MESFASQKKDIKSMTLDELRADMKIQGHTQYELAEKAHISRSHLSSIEAPNITASFYLFHPY